VQFCLWLFSELATWLHHDAWSVAIAGQLLFLGNAMSPMSRYEQASVSLLARTPAILPEGDATSKPKWEDFRNYLERRLAGLRDWRLSWWTHWADLALNILPRRYHWLITPNMNVRGREINGAIVDTTVIKAFRICAAGLMNGLTSPSRPWFALVPAISDIEIPREWQLWFDEVQRRVQVVMGASNFYDSLTQLFQDLVVFGTAPMIIYEDLKDVIRCFNPCAGEFYVANGGDFRVNTLYRTFVHTTMQMVDFFGHENIPAEIKTAWNNKSGLDTEYVVAHAIEPNFSAQSFGNDKANLGVVPGGYNYREVYWLFGRSSSQPLSVKGFNDKPFICPRWETTSNDPYGRSVGMDVLQDIKQLYLMQKRLAEAIEKQVRPPMQASVTLKNQPASILPGAVTFVADIEKGGMKPIYTVTPQIREMLEQIKALQDRVKDGFYNNLFLMISQMPGTQPRNELEITERKNEQMQELGPVIEKFQNEGASPAIQRIISIMARRGLLPPKPAGMAKLPIKIEYISMLTLAQRATKTAGMDRWLNIIASLVKLGDTDAIDNVNSDEFCKEYAADLTVPNKVQRSADEMKARRQQRAQGQQQAAQMQHVKELAKPLADASTAAQNFSNIPEGGGMDVVARMLGGGGLAA
jgi:hypothetical protein